MLGRNSTVSSAVQRHSRICGPSWIKIGVLSLRAVGCIARPPKGQQEVPTALTFPPVTEDAISRPSIIDRGNQKWNVNIHLKKVNIRIDVAFSAKRSIWTNPK